MPIRDTGRQAIITKYLGPTNARGARIKASSYARDITVPYDHSLNMQRNHAAAAEFLINRQEWGGDWVQGGHPSGDGFVFVDLAQD